MFLVGVNLLAELAEVVIDVIVVATFAEEAILGGLHPRTNFFENLF